MTFICKLCNNEFKTKFTLNRHIEKIEICFNKKELINRIEELENKKSDVIISGTNNTIRDINPINNTINIKVELNINPVQKLNTSHIHAEEMKRLIEQYDLNPNKLNLLLGGYVKNIICDPEHPENQPTKYITKRPPTYNSIIEDHEGNKINVIKGLKDTCELLSDPILDTLKIKLRQFLKKYRKDVNFNYLIYEETISELRNELNKTNVKKALSTVLQNDILNNIEMKLSLEPK